MSPPEIDIDHLRDKHNLPQAGTGKWIFETVEYKEWYESSDSKLLWLCGGPGAGKTMLAKNVAAEVLKGPDGSSRGVKLGFHFAQHGPPIAESSATEAEPPGHSLAKVASDLLYSILQQDGTLFDGCKAELKKQGFFTNPSSLWKALRKAIQDCQTDPVYILIDGVDGLGGKSYGNLIERTLGLMDIRPVKIFLSCREVPYISNSLSCGPPECSKIDLDTSSFVAKDVETLIRNRVNACGWGAELTERAVKDLLEKSEGIFLWASLAIDNLTQHSSGPDFQNLLTKPLSKLEEVYQKISHSLSSRKVSREILNMIQSVALALRPLTFYELGYILACLEREERAQQQSSHRETNRKIRPRRENEIRMFVKSAMGFLRATETTVSIVHHTAIEYLFGEGRGSGLLRLSKSEADLIISWECFRYLHHAFRDPKRSPKGRVKGDYNASLEAILGGEFPDEELGGAPREVARKHPQEAATKLPFLRYAAESWFIHARRSIEISKDNFCDDSAYNWLQYQFFETSDIIRNPWIELCGDLTMAVLAGEQTTLHIVACLGLMPLVEKALLDLTKGKNWNFSLLRRVASFISGAYKILINKSESSFLIVPDRDGNIPLDNAGVSHRWSMLKALVKQSAGRRVNSSEINKKNHTGNTPLHLAYQFNHTEIAELLVKYGANLEIKINAQIRPSELGVKPKIRNGWDTLKPGVKDREGPEKEIMQEPTEGPVENPIAGAAGELVLGAQGQFAGSMASLQAPPGGEMDITYRTQ